MCLLECPPWVPFGSPWGVTAVTTRRPRRILSGKVQMPAPPDLTITLALGCSVVQENFNVVERNLRECNILQNQVSSLPLRQKGSVCEYEFTPVSLSAFNLPVPAGLPSLKAKSPLASSGLVLGEIRCNSICLFFSCHSLWTKSCFGYAQWLNTRPCSNSRM